MPVEKAAAEQVAMRLLTASTEKPPWLTVALAWPPSVKGPLEEVLGERPVRERASSRLFERDQTLRGN
jgi:hypothetical protein